MLDPNTITKEYGQQAEACRAYARGMLEFVSIQQAYLAHYMIPHSNIGGLDNHGAKASMFGLATLSMHKAIKEVEKIDDKTDINEVVDSARLVCQATREAHEQLMAAPDSLDGNASDKSEIKIARAIVNTMLECSESALRMAKAAVCVTQVVEAVGDAERANPAAREGKSPD